jgi:hypothetical protein
MVIDTITFSDKSEGWTSRWTYRPEWMMGLNSSFYSFKNGNLYKHDTNINRTQFYNEPINSLYGFSISTVINQSPTEIKMFKTLALDCTHSLNFVGYTDLDDAQMSMSQFVNKEGEWYSYMRRPVNQINFDLISAQGVGNVLSTTAPDIITTQSKFTNISKGDEIYKASFAGTMISGVNYVGTIDYVDQSNNEIKLDAAFATPLQPGDFLVSFKSSSAESYGTRGYFLNLTLSRSGSDATPEIELFAVSTAVFKSFP